MNKLLLTLLLLSSTGTGLFAQRFTKFFELESPTFQVQNSLYNKIEFMDSRLDTSTIGLLIKGQSSTDVTKMVLKSPFQAQLTNLVHALNDSTAKDGELLFQLKRFKFVETLGPRFCYLSAALYVKKDDKYQKLSSLNTVIKFRGASPENALRKEGNEEIIGFIAEGLLSKPTDSSLYSIQEIENIDSIEKRQIPLYNTDKYVDGLYFSYSSFKKQIPDAQGFVNMTSDGSISSVKIPDTSGKKVKVKSNTFYALVYKGMPFVTNEYGYYPLQKINDNFFFTGDVNMPASTGDMLVAGAVLGFSGAASASRGSVASYYMLVNYMNGDFIHLATTQTNAP